MALYFYQALSREGKRVTGYLDAPTLQVAREQLSKMGVYPTTVQAATTQASQVPWYKRLFSRGITLKDKIFFTRQLAVLLKSGIPLVQALDLLVEQTEGRLQTVVISLRDGIKEGKSLADELQRFPGAFDTIYIQLVRAGEASGKLEVILERLNDYLERREAVRKKVSGALRYPLIQLILLLVVVSGLLAFIVPQITTIFEEQKLQLPLPTRILIGLSNFIINYYIVIVIALIVLIALITLWSKTDSGRYTLDRLKLKLPIVSYFSKTGAIVQFCRTLGMLIESGVNLSEALTIVVKVVNNRVLTDTLERARENIIKQGKIAQYLKETGLFPPVAIYLINTGEQSGQLDAMLLTVARYYEDDLEQRADSLSGLLNPIMLIIMAGLIGFILASIMLPLLSLGSATG